MPNFILFQAWHPTDSLDFSDIIPYEHPIDYMSMRKQKKLLTYRMSSMTCYFHDLCNEMCKTSSANSIVLSSILAAKIQFCALFCAILPIFRIHAAPKTLKPLDNQGVSKHGA